MDGTVIGEEGPLAYLFGPPGVVHVTPNSTTAVPRAAPGVNCTVAWPTPAVADTPVGALGVKPLDDVGVTVFDQDENEPQPALFRPWTRQWYAVPGVSDDTVTGEAEAEPYLAEPPATGEHAAEYELIGEPFAEPGVKLTVARDGPAVAATFVGAAGLPVVPPVGVTEPE